MRVFGHSAGYEIGLAAPPGAAEREALSGGFSLIELLLVMTLILVLMTLYWGHGSASRQRQQLAACESHLEKLSVALQIYATDNSGKFPLKHDARTSEEALDALVPRYTVDTSLFICPAGRDSALSPGAPIRDEKISYAYYMGRCSTNALDPLLSDRQVNTGPKMKGDPLFSSTGKPPGDNHGRNGGNVLFGDGRVESCASNAPVALLFSAPVRLLNPRP